MSAATVNASIGYSVTLPAQRRVIRFNPLALYWDWKRPGFSARVR